eukprot:4663420-Amphidinium_carterae.2
MLHQQFARGTRVGRLFKAAGIQQPSRPLLHVCRSQSTEVPYRDGPSYLDMQATTPVDPRVLDAMMPYYGGRFGNPHSRSHSYGWDAEEATETARKQIADLIGADSKEIFFTSGAT